jgi:hypothetical protein
MMKRILLVTATAATAILACVTAAQAAVTTNTTVSYAYSGWVPCANDGAGELVTGTIDAHVLSTSTENADVDAWQFMFAPRGELVGRTSGATYRLTGVEHGTYATATRGDTSVLTYVHRYQLIGAGGAGNLVVRETAHITTKGDDAVVQFDDFIVECA